jgi:flagellar hook-length control protein FliK
MPSAIEAAFLIPARPEHRHDALTPPDVRQKASTAVAPVTGTVTLPAQRFGAFVNPAGNSTADPAADLMPIAEPEADGTLRLAATETASSALRGTTSAFTHFAPPQNTSQTMTQIVAAISRASVDGQKTTEITLNPAELGRVRLHLATTDGVMIVMVSAERAETMELLRRNIETLTNNLKETGYDGAQIVFSQDGGGARDKEARAPVTAPTRGSPVASTPDTPPPVLVMLGDRLDLRV